MKLLLLVCALLCAEVLSGPVGQYKPGQCAKICKPTDKFDYEVGHTYEYEYILENSIGVKNNDQSKLNLRATVLITPQTSCEFVLQLRDVVVEGDYGNLATDLQKFPLTFAFQDGRIEELCPSVEERQDILNIKRGILSSLQNSMINLDGDHVVQEVDVSGDCVAEYSIYSTSWGGAKTIIKKKDLNACKDRSAHMTGIHGVRYHVDSDYQGLPLIKSTHKCEQVIDGKLIQKSKCEESHTLRPFSDDDSAATSTSTQTLTYRQKTDVQIVPQTEMAEKTDLLFNHLANTEDKDAVKRTAVNILRELAEESQEEVTPQQANKFSHLVATLRKLPFTQLRAVYKTVINEPRLKQFFLDALPVIGTGAGINMMHEAIMNGDVTEDEANMWYTSLAFTNKPTTEMLEASMVLLGDVYQKQAMLGVSAMLHKFCVVNSNCVEYPEVKSLIRKFESHLGSACRTTTKEEEDKVMVVLKAIGNAGVFTNHQVLNQCFTEDTNSMRVRVSALEAFRRLPCSYDIRHEAMKTFREVSLDAELRIASYLTVMRCPDHQVINEIKEALSSEPVNQVGSFIWTHLTNLQETSDPAKQEAKELLVNDFLRNKFNSNALKYSRNYEMSLFSKKWNIGSQVESNVIFSKSPIPRSVNYNFTINLFGESINLFEIGGRVEGFESFLARFFGPNGYFPEEHVENMLEAMGKKQDVEDDVNRLSSEKSDPTLDAFLRVFGNELSYGSFKTIEDIKNAFGDFDPFKIIRQLVQDKQIDYTRANHFLNAQFTVPTSSGLPLSVNLNGTAVLRLQAEGDMSSHSEGMDVSGKIKPSAAVELATLMSVEAGDITTGIQVLSTLHTATVLDTGFTYNRGKIMNVHINMPKERQEIINIDSKVFLVNKQERREISKGSADLMSIDVCTGETTSKPFGVQICGEIGVSSGFPLHGPGNAKIYIEKTDDFNQYLFEIKQTQEQDYHTYGITLDTPNSRVNRRNLITTVVDYASGKVEGKLETPFKTFGLTGNYKYEPVKKLISLVGTSDNEQIFALRASLNTAQSPRRVNTFTVKPELSLTIFNNEIAALQGSYDSSDSGKTSLDLVVSSMFLIEPMEFRGNVNTRDNKRAASAIIKTPVFDGEISGQLAHDKFSLSATYHTAGQQKENFEISGKYSATKQGDETLVSGNFGLKISAAPHLNIDGEVMEKINKNGIEGKLRFEGLANFEFNHKLSYEKKYSRYFFGDAELQLNFECLRTGNSYGIHYLQRDSGDGATLKLSTRTNTKYDFVFAFHALHQTSPMRYGADVSFKTAETNIKLTGKIAQSSESEFDTNLAAEWTPEYKIKASGKFINSPQTKQATIFFKLPRSNPVQLEASVSNHHGSFSVMTQVKYEEQQYSTTVDYLKSKTEHQLVGRVTTPSSNHAVQIIFTNTNDKKSITFDLNCDRHVNAKASFSRNLPTIAEFEVSWDISRDPTKKLSAILTAQDETFRLDGSFLHHALTASVTKRNNFFDAWIDWGERIALNLDFTDKLEVTLTTPFQGYKTQRLIVASELQPEYVMAEIGGEWGENEKLGLKFESRFTRSRDAFAINGQLSSESTLHPFIDGLSISYDQYQAIKDGRSLLRVDHQGQTYQASSNYVIQREGYVFSYVGEFETLTPSTKSTGNIVLEYDGKELHYKQKYNVPGMTDHELEISTKYNFNSGKFSLDSDVRYSSSFYNPIHFIFNFQGKEKKLKAATSLIYGQETLIDVNVRASLVSPNTLNGTVKAKIFDNIFEGAFDHNVAFGSTTLLNTKVEGNLNGKKLTAFIDGRYTPGTTTRETFLDASLSSPWEAYNDWRITFQHSVKNKRYQTTLTVNKGSTTASIDQDLSIYNLSNFEHKLSINSPYENVKYITINTQQQWDDKNFVHDTKGLWNDKSIVTSARLNHKNTRYGQQIHGDMNIQTPFSNDIKGTINHEYDGTKFNPVLRFDYGENTLLSLEAGGYFDVRKGETKIKVRLPNYRPVTVTITANFQKPTKQEGVLTVEYGDNKKVEFSTKTEYDGDFTIVQYSWDVNGHKTENYIKFRYTDAHIEGEYYLTQPSFPAIKLHGSIIKEDNKQVLEFTGNYGSDQYDIKALTILEPLGKIELVFNAPNDRKYFLMTYNGAGAEKSITGYVEDNSEKYEFHGSTKATLQEGFLKFDAQTPVSGFHKTVIDASYSNDYQVKKFMLRTKKDDHEISVKGKASLGVTGDISLEIVKPTEGHKIINFQTGYDFASQEKSISLNGQFNHITVDLSFKTKFTAIESYVTADISTPWSKKQSANLYFKSADNRMTIKGDWNDEKVQIESFFTNRNLNIEARWRDKKIALVGEYNDASAKVQLISDYENMEVSADWSNSGLNFRLRRNDENFIIEVQSLSKEFIIQLRTPIADYEHIYLNMKYDYSDNLYLTVTATQNQRTLVDGKINIEAKTPTDQLPEAAQLSVHIKTAITGFENNQLIARYDFSKTLPYLTITLTQNQRTLLDGKISGHTPSQGEMKLVTHLSLPLLETKLSAVGDFNMNSHIKTANIELSRNNEKIMMKLSAEFGKTETEFSTHIATPYPEYKDIVEKLTIGYGQTTKYAKLTSSVNQEVNTYGIELTMGEGKLSLRIYSPLQDYEDLMITGEYILTPSEKSTKVTFTKNGETREFGIGGKYEDDSAESSFRVKTPEYERAITARVRRSLDLYYTDAYTSPQDSRVIEVEASIRGDRDSGKAHFKASTDFTGWEHTELLLTYDFKTQEKTFDVKLTNGEKTYRYSGQAEIKDNMIKGAIQTMHTGYERLSITLEHELVSKNKYVRLAVDTNGQQNYVYALGEFDKLYSFATVTVDTFFAKGEVKFSYDIRGSDKQLSGKVTVGNDVYQFKSNVQLGLNGNINWFSSLPNYSCNMNIDYDIRSPTKTVDLSYTHNDQTHYMRTSLTMQQKQIEFELQSSIEHFERLTGKAEYEFEPQEKNAKVSFEWNNIKYEFNGKIETRYDSTELTLDIVSPIQNYENIRLNSKVIRGRQPRVELRFSSPTSTLEGTAGYELQKLNGQTTIDITSNVEQIGNINFHATYDLRASEKYAEFTFVRNEEKHTGDLRVMYDGTLMKGHGFVKLNMPFLVNIDTEVTTNITPKLENSEIKIRFGKYNFEIHSNLSLKNGYLKYESNFETIKRFSLTWDTMNKSDGRLGGQVILSVNDYQYFEVMAYFHYYEYDNFRAIFELESPVVDFKKLEISWKIDSPRKFQANLKTETSNSRQEHQVDVTINDNQGYLKFNTDGYTRESYEFVTEYTLSDNKLNLDIRTPFSSPIRVEIALGVKNPLYAFKMGVAVGETVYNIDFSVYLYQRFEFEAKLPIEGYDDVHILYEMVPQDYGTDLLIKFENSGDVISLEQTFSKKDNKYLYYALFQTPIAGFEKIQVDMSLNESVEGYEGGLDFEQDENHVSGRFGVVFKNPKKTSFFVNLKTPFQGYTTLNLDASFTHDTTTNNTKFLMQFEKEYSVYDMKGIASIGYPQYYALLSIKTPLDALKDISLEIKYNSEQKHNIEMRYNQNNISIEGNGKIFVTSSEGDANFDIRTNIPNVNNMNFQSSYNFVSAQKKLSVYIDLFSKRPIAFDSIWNYSTDTFAKASLQTPWSQPNFNIIIEGDLKHVQKYAMVKYESNGDSYEVKFDTDTLVIMTPMYEVISFKLMQSENSVVATAAYGLQVIEFSIDCTKNKGACSINAYLRTPFAHYENIQLRTYFKSQNEFNVKGSLVWDNDKVFDGEVYISKSKLTAKLDSPYSPYKNMFADFTIDKTRDYKIHGIITWDENQIELNGYMSSSSLSLDINTPFEPFKDMHLEGSLRKESNEFGINGYGKWQGKKVKVNGSFFSYEDFGIKTNLEVETPIAGYENYALYLDIKKPMSQNGIDANLEVRTRDSTKTMTFLLTHNGPTDFDVVLTVLKVKSNLSFRLNRDISAGHTEVKLSGSLPVEYLSKFSLYGKIAYPSTSKLMVDVELQTSSEVNKLYGNYAISSKEITAELSAEMPLLLLKPVTVTFSLKNRSYKNFNLTGVLILPHKTYEVHGSFVMENNSLKMLFKENGLYNIEVEVSTIFEEGIVFDAVLFLPGSKHNLNGSFQKSNDGIDIRGEITTPLLQHTIGFKVSTTYKDNLLDLVMSLTSEDTYILRASYVRTGNKYSGEIMYEVSGTRNLLINLEYEPINGSVTIHVPSGTHQFTFSLQNRKMKTSFNVSARCPLLPGNSFEANFNFKNEVRAKKVSLKVTSGTQTHTIMGLISLDEVEKKLETTIETPLFNLKTIRLNSYLTNKNDVAEGEVLVDVSNETHSIRAILGNNFNGEFRINSPWLKSQQLLITTKFENFSYKSVFADVSMKNGEQKFHLTGKYDISDPSFYEGYMILRSSFQNAKFIEISGHLRTTDRTEYEIKFDSENLPKFQVTGGYLSNESSINASLNIKSSIESINNSGIHISIPLKKGEHLRIVVNCLKTKYELSGNIFFQQDGLTVEGTTSWNNKEVVGSVHMSYENPIKLSIDIQTPFQGYERLRYHGKLFWEIGEYQINKKYHVGVEWNEKVIELRGVKNENTLSVELVTPFYGYERSQAELISSPIKNGRSLYATLEFHSKKWQANVEYSFLRYHNAWAKVELTTPYHNMNYYAHTSFNFYNDKYNGNLMVNLLPYTFLNLNTEAVITDNGVSFNYDDQSNNKLHMAAYLTPDQEIGGEYYINVPDKIENSGKFSATALRTEEKVSYGVSASSNEKELFEIKITSEHRRVVIKVINPLYPVSLRYTYDNTPQTFEIEGEFCWNLNKAIETTIGGNLKLQKTNQGATLQANVAAPHHQAKVYVTYILKDTQFNHEFSLSGTINGEQHMIGYVIDLNTVVTTEEVQNNGVIKVNIPKYPVDITFTLKRHPRYVSGNIELLHKETTNFSFNLVQTEDNVYEGYATLNCPCLNVYDITVKSQLVYADRYGLSVEIRNALAEEVRFSALLQPYYQDNKKSMTTNVHFKCPECEFDFNSDFGYDLEKYFGRLDYNWNQYYNEYFLDVYNRKFRIGQLNVFLIEGSLTPTDSGLKSSLKGQFGDEEYNATVVADNHPAFIEVSAKHDTQTLLNARFDASDILSTKIYLKLGLFYEIEDILSEFI